MTSDGMTPERAREVMVEHEGHAGSERGRVCYPADSMARADSLPRCLPYTLAAAYVAACAELITERRRWLIAAGHVRGLTAELATAQGRIDAALTHQGHDDVCGSLATGRADRCDCWRAALIGDLQ